MDNKPNYKKLETIRKKYINQLAALLEKRAQLWARTQAIYKNDGSAPTEKTALYNLYEESDKTSDNIRNIADEYIKEISPLLYAGALPEEQSSNYLETAYFFSCAASCGMNSYINYIERIKAAARDIDY